MDTIILAAGENVRLQVAGLAPGRKPLIIKNGEVLIRRLCRQVREMYSYKERIVIVTSPSNAEDIVFATRQLRPLYIVQPEANGPQDAVDLALELVKSVHVMLLMGDNYIETLPDYQSTGIAVTAKNDPSLHPVYEGRLIYERDVPEVGAYRWLGPLIFRSDVWLRNADDWVHAFAADGAPPFKYLNGCGAEDMGVL